MLEERERAFPRRPSGARAEPLRPRSPGETPSGAGAGLSPGAELAEAAERRRRGRSREPGLAGGGGAAGCGGAGARRWRRWPRCSWVRGAGGDGRGRGAQRQAFPLLLQRVFPPACLSAIPRPPSKPSESSLPLLPILPSPLVVQACLHVRLPFQAPALSPVHFAALTALTVALCPSL